MRRVEVRSHCTAWLLWSEVPALRAQVKRLHGKEEEAWGFIRPCDRAQDLFFHSAALAPGLTMAELAPGDDVEFCVARDPTPEQPQAHRGHQVLH